MEKRRESYILDFQGKKIEILVDQVQYLSGNYLEAELMAKDESEMAPIKKILLEFLDKIGYGEEDTIVESYLELVMKILLKPRRKRKNLEK